MLQRTLSFKLAAAGLLAACVSVGCANGTSPVCDGKSTECSGADLNSGVDAGSVSAAIDAGTKDPAKSVAAHADASVLASKKTLPCDVKRIVDDKCGLCHGAEPIGGAPMSLLSPDDFQAQASDKRVMYANVKDKINATDPRVQMPPTSAKPLTSDELSTLNAWLDKSAPASSTTCAAAQTTSDAGTAQADVPYMEPSDDELTCYRMLAHGDADKSKFKVGVAVDSYFTFTFDAPWKDTQYGIVIRPVIDNKKVLHHWLLFQDVVPSIAGGAVPEIGAHPTGQLLAVWAPGADPVDLRKAKKQVGMELSGDTTYTVEFHYNSNDADAEDASGVEVCVAKNKPTNVAAYSWLGYDNLGAPEAQWTGTCTPFSSDPIHIISFMPHMHLTGIHMKGTVNRSDGTDEVVHDAPFDFNYQVSYPVDLTINPGDSITTVCDYSVPGVFGQPTDKEMCYLFALAYPKGALASPDIWGGVAHGASSCLGQ